MLNPLSHAQDINEYRREVQKSITAIEYLEKLIEQITSSEYLDTKAQRMRLLKLLDSRVYVVKQLDGYE
ncbi:hypothetical protein V6O07_08695, partial [Arthrospira platensis SPKY2]